MLSHNSHRSFNFTFLVSNKELDHLWKEKKNKYFNKLQVWSTSLIFSCYLIFQSSKTTESLLRVPVKSFGLYLCCGCCVCSFSLQYYQDEAYQSSKAVLHTKIKQLHLFCIWPVQNSLGCEAKKTLFEALYNFIVRIWTPTQQHLLNIVVMLREHRKRNHLYIF